MIKTNKLMLKLRYVIALIMGISLIYFIVSLDCVKEQVDLHSSNIIFTYSDCVNIVSKKNTNERMARKYLAQEQECQKLIDYFKEKKESMEYILDELGMVKHREIIIVPESNLDLFYSDIGKKYKAYRRLVFSGDGANFQHSDFLSYMEVASNSSLLKAFEDLNFKISWIKISDGNAVFYLGDLYFQNSASVSITYHGREDREDYYTDGIKIESGWSIDITEKSQGNRDYFLTLTSPQFPTSVYPVNSYNDYWLNVANSEIQYIVNILITIFLLCLIYLILSIKKTVPYRKGRIKLLLTVTMFNLLVVIVVNNMGFLFVKPIKESRIEKEYKALPWRIDDTDSWIYAAYQADYKKQVDFYKETVEIFLEYREPLEYIIEQTYKQKPTLNMAYYLLDDDWKKYLLNVPGGEVLKQYGHFFWVYTDRDGDNVPLFDRELTIQAQKNIQLTEILDLLGKKGDIMEIVFFNNYVQVKLIGSFWEEKSIAELYYFNGTGNKRSEANTTEMMWIDDKWMLYMPYPIEELGILH